MDIRFNGVVRISVTPPELVDYEGSFWKSGHIILEHSDGSVDKIPYSTDHHKDRDFDLQVTTSADEDVLKENRQMREILGELNSIFEKALGDRNDHS